MLTWPGAVSGPRYAGHGHELETFLGLMATMLQDARPLIYTAQIVSELCALIKVAAVLSLMCSRDLLLETRLTLPYFT